MDRAKIGIWECDKVFEELVCAMPGVSYDFETTSHLYLAQKYIRMAAEIAFPLSGPTKTDKDMSQHTFGAITDHSKAFRKYHWALRRLCTNLLYVVFGAWAGFSSRTSLTKYWYMSRRVLHHNLWLLL